jgi:hypothetical protein
VKHGMVGLFLAAALECARVARTSGPVPDAAWGASSCTAGPHGSTAIRFSARAPRPASSQTTSVTR